jgi:hypothetical protein
MFILILIKSEIASMNVDAKQRYLMIAEAAYFRAEQRNFSPGHEQKDWLAAERQVDEMLKDLTAVPMQAELQSQAQAKLSARKVRKQPAKAPAAPKTAATTEAKPARKQQAKAAAPTTEAKPTRTRRAKAAAVPATGAASTTSISGAGAGTATGVKPKRGRPRKVVSAEAVIPTKRPGRPRKTALH